MEARMAHSRAKHAQRHFVTVISAFPFIKCAMFAVFMIFCWRFVHKVLFVLGNFSHLCRVHGLRAKLLNAKRYKEKAAMKKTCVYLPDLARTSITHIANLVKLKPMQYQKAPRAQQ